MTVTVQTSVVPAVKRALKHVLDDRPGLAGVLISWGTPYPADIPEYIWIGNVEPHEQSPSGMRTAPHSREETFSLNVQISVLQTGTEDHELVTERAYELAAEIEDALRDDMTINGSLGNGWAQVGGLPLEERGPDENATRESVINARIDCRARIRGA
jgi:hypothetical protein